MPNVTRIDDYAFQGCSALENVGSLPSLLYIGDDAFDGCDALPVIDNLRYIDTFLYSVVDRTLDSYSIKEGTKMLHHGCFSGCAMTSLNIPEGVISIGQYAFAGCSFLESVTLPNSLEEIYSHAFMSCSSLKKIIIPNAWLGEQVFQYCDCLSTIIMKDVAPSLSAYSFNGTHATVYVPVGSYSIYENTPGHKKISEITSLYDNAIYASPAEARTSTTVTIPINMKNSVTATGYSFSLVLPEAIAPSSVTLKKSTARKEDEMSFSKAVQADGSIKVVCYSTDGQPFSGNDGEVATLTFTVPADMEVGDYPIIIKNAELSENGTPHKIPEEIISRLHIESYLLGDANMDGEVSVSDLTCIVSYLLNLDVPETFYAKAADANEDGDVSVSDLSTIVNIILYGNPNGANGAKARGERSAAECLFTATPFTIAPGEEATLSLLLSSNQEVTAFQFDALLPDGLTCTNAKRTSLVSDEHSFRSASLDDNLTRIVCYSGSNATFEANEGTIAELTIKADKDMLPGLYALNLQNAEVVSLNGSAKLDGQSIAFEVVAPMGIEILGSEHEDMPRYDLMGRRINNNNDGTIFIEHGKKTVVR